MSPVQDTCTSHIRTIRTIKPAQDKPIHVVLLGASLNTGNMGLSAACSRNSNFGFEHLPESTFLSIGLRTGAGHIHAPVWEQVRRC